MIRRAAVLLVGLAIGGCSLALPYVAVGVERDERTCANRIDDDLDGLADCLDDDCQHAHVCQEASDGACADGLDNDRDERVDCFDDGCFATAACAELGTERCTNTRDNDGDGVTDAADARCWPFRRVAVERCSSIDQTRFVEHFDDPIGFAERFYTVGGDAQIILATDGEPALLVAPTPGRSDTTVVGTTASFRGAFRGLDLSMLVNIAVDGAVVRIALVPTDLAPIGAPRSATDPGDVAAIVLHDRDSAAVQGPSSTEMLPWVGSGWQRVTLREADGALHATIEPLAGLGTGARAVFPPLPLGDLALEATPSFRILFESLGAVLVRDVRIGLEAFDPCNTTVPQIPPGARVGVPGGVVSMGDGVSVTRGANGLCAIVMGCEWVGSSTWPTTRSFRSTDEGVTWTATDRAFPIGVGTNYGGRGLSVAWDADQNVYRALAVRGLDPSGARPLAVSQSADCETWSLPDDLALRYVPSGVNVEGCGALGAGLSAPSFVVRRVDGATRYEIYWTFSALPSDPLVLLRAVSNDGVHFGTPAEVTRFEGSDTPGEPVSVTAIGTTDLVLTAPLGPSTGRSGIGVRIALDEAGSRFLPIGDALLGPSETPSTFDRFAIVSGALAPTHDGVLLLYGAAGDFHFDPYTQVGGAFSSGTARVRFADLVATATP